MERSLGCKLSDEVLCDAWRIHHEYLAAYVRMAWVFLLGVFCKAIFHFYRHLRVKRMPRQFSNIKEWSTGAVRNSFLSFLHCNSCERKSTLGPHRSKPETLLLSRYIFHLDLRALINVSIGARANNASTASGSAGYMYPCISLLVRKAQATVLTGYCSKCAYLRVVLQSVWLKCQTTAKWLRFWTTLARTRSLKTELYLKNPTNMFRNNATTIVLCKSISRLVTSGDVDTYIWLHRALISPKRKNRLS